MLYQSAGLDGRQRGAAAERSAVCTAHARSRDRAPAGVHLRARAARGRRGRRERAALLPASCRESHRAVELRVKGSMIHPRTPATARLTPDTRAPLGNLRPSHSRARDTACAPGARASAAESAPSVGCRAAGPPRTVAISPTSRNRFGRKLPFPVSMACLNVLSRRLRRANHCTQWSRIRTSTPIISAPRKMSLEKTKMGAVGSPPLGANPPGAASSRPRSARPRRKYSETHPQRKKKNIKVVADPSKIRVPSRRWSHFDANGPTAPPRHPVLGPAAPPRACPRGHPTVSGARRPSVSRNPGGARGGGNLCRASDAPQRARAATFGAAGAQARARTRTWHARTFTGACTRAVRPHTEVHTRTHTHAHARTHARAVTHTQHSTRARSSGGRCAHARAAHTARARPRPCSSVARRFRSGAPGLFFFPAGAGAGADRRLNRNRTEPEPPRSCGRLGGARPRPRLRAPQDRIRSLVWRAPRARARPRSDRRPPPTPPQPQSFQPAYPRTPGAIALLQKNNDSFVLISK